VRLVRMDGLFETDGAKRASDTPCKLSSLPQFFASGQRCWAWVAGQFPDSRLPDLTLHAARNYGSSPKNGKAYQANQANSSQWNSRFDLNEEFVFRLRANNIQSVAINTAFTADTE
jgi:hypothetical protein